MSLVINNNKLFQENVTDLENGQEKIKTKLHVKSRVNQSQN